MGNVVECPYCQWRGYKFYFPRHFKEEHDEMMFSMPKEVDFTRFDSRPIHKGRPEK